MEGTNAEVPKEKSIEGDLVSWRGLRAYADWLRFEPHLLTGQTVLNFGSGGSHIGKELEKKKILCNVIDADLKLTGVGPKGFLFSAILQLIDHHVDPDSDLHKRLAHIKRMLAGANGRKLIQADGRTLPFKDRTFDTVLALVSTYQVPEEAKELVYKELMRVGDVIHCSPIHGNDFKVLEALAQKDNFDIIVCHPTRTIFSKRDEFLADNIDYYQAYKEKYSEEQRVSVPTRNSASTLKIFGKPMAGYGRGNFIVLQRRKD